MGDGTKEEIVTYNEILDDIVKKDIAEEFDDTPMFDVNDCEMPQFDLGRSKFCYHS